MYKILESRMIKDPFLIKDIVEFNYYKMYDKLSNKKIILKPSIKLGTPYKNLENIIQQLDSKKDYLLIDGFIHLSKRSVNNKIYIINYEELLVWINEIDDYFEGPVNIMPVEKSNPDSYANATKIFSVIEEGVFFLF
ncbi:hypothetical protein [Chryseobacterium mucoviscidosis]|uniref:Uncharacterized protein n=1 Tax=Chryseobacterium mucoviscidosis TaxID=1945581 RepID=A0A202BWF4_9FLAO|nr:hypothetical protein [Chryseobacterium mucoviscidosis]OVE55811.1 hypothetical protein B0E34_16480 [Chryseobacterium mucoviscidosis]